MCHFDLIVFVWKMCAAGKSPNNLLTTFICFAILTSLMMGKMRTEINRECSGVSGRRCNVQSRFHILIDSSICSRCEIVPQPIIQFLLSFVANVELLLIHRRRLKSHECKRVRVCAVCESFLFIYFIIPISDNIF